METNNRKKIAVVTGGTRGIGKAITLDLARDGFKVFALYARNREAANAVEAIASKENLEIVTLRGDLTKKEVIAQHVQEITSSDVKVDVLVHNAASGVHRNAEKLTSKHMKWTMDINVFAAHELITKLLPHFNPGARVIGITSSGGTSVIPFYSAVGSSKGALESLFRHYASEFASKEISVNLICPGMVATDAIEAFPDKEDRLKNAIAGTPTGRLTTVEEVAELANFLCTSRLAMQMIGQTFVIDGGRCLQS